MSGMQYPFRGPKPPEPPKSFSEEDELQTGDEEERVIAWRFLRLLEGGYDLEEAQAIAVDKSIDLHKAVKLVKSGCPYELATGILV